MQKMPGYAESQIRVLLKDLMDTSHSIRAKAVSKFKDYVDRVRPEMYDDDVEYLFTGGIGAGKLPDGLLYYAGECSSKHAGQLKRIAAPVIELIRWLIKLDMSGDRNSDGAENDNNIYDNIFYDQFICLTEEDLQKVSFQKHILLGDASSSSSARGGSQDCARTSKCIA